MRPLKAPHYTAQKDIGFSLIELMIAVIVLSVGTLAVMRTLDQSRLEIGGAPARFLAQSVAVNRAEELRVMGVALGRSLPETVTQGPYVWTITTTTKETESGLIEVTLQVHSEGQPGAVFTSYAPWEPPS